MSIQMAMPSSHLLWIVGDLPVGVGVAAWIVFSPVDDPRPRCPACGKRLVNMEDGTHWCDGCNTGHDNEEGTKR